MCPPECISRDSLCFHVSLLLMLTMTTWLRWYLSSFSTLNTLEGIFRLHMQIYYFSSNFFHLGTLASKHVFTKLFFFFSQFCFCLMVIFQFPLSCYIYLLIGILLQLRELISWTLILSNGLKPNTTNLFCCSSPAVAIRHSSKLSSFDKPPSFLESISFRINCS